MHQDTKWTWRAREDKTFERALNVLTWELVKVSGQEAYVEDTFGGFNGEFAVPYVHGLAYTLEDWDRYCLVMAFKYLVIGERDLEGNKVSYWSNSVLCSEGRW